MQTTDCSKYIMMFVAVKNVLQEVQMHVDEVELAKRVAGGGTQTY